MREIRLEERFRRRRFAFAVTGFPGEGAVIKPCTAEPCNCAKSRSHSACASAAP